MFVLFIPRVRNSQAFGVLAVCTQHGMGWLLYMALQLELFL